MGGSDGRNGKRERREGRWRERMTEADEGSVGERGSEIEEGD